MQYSWIVALEGKGPSGALNVNFLWKQGSIAISDNHLFAAWAWLQDSISLEKHSILHIDAHFDTAGVHGYPNGNAEDLRALSFAEYRAIRHVNDSDFPAFRWDNYLSIYRNLNLSLLENITFSTHRIDDEPGFKFDFLEADSLAAGIALIPSGKQWIINLDIDFFRTSEGYYGPPEWRRQILKELAAFKLRCASCVLTIALSPDCCGGWNHAEAMLQEVANAFEFTPPNLTVSLS